MIVPVEAELAVQLLVPVGHVRDKAVVLETLHVAVGALCEQRAVGIVVIDLHNAVSLRDDHSIVALMILQVEMVGGGSCAAEGVVPVVCSCHRKIIVGEYVSVYVVCRRTQWAQHVWPKHL